MRTAATRRRLRDDAAVGAVEINEGHLVIDNVENISRLAIGGNQNLCGTVVNRKRSYNLINRKVDDAQDMCIGDGYQRILTIGRNSDRKRPVTHLNISSHRWNAT